MTSAAEYRALFDNCKTELDRASTTLEETGLQRVALAQVNAGSGWLYVAAQHLVTDARDFGTSWQGIGEALGVSRQAAQQRFRR